MKTVMVLIAVMCLVIPITGAQDSPLAIPEEFTAKQGMLMLWSNQNLQHSTTFEAIKTRECPSWPKWANALWNGNTIDVGFAYDAANADNAVIAVSRTVGTLGNYLPIDFPILEKFHVSITPLAIEMRHFTTDLSFDGASGFSYFEVKAKF